MGHGALVSPSPQSPIHREKVKREDMDLVWQIVVQSPQHDA